MQARDSNYMTKLYVSFAKEPCKRDDILQERPVILLDSNEMTRENVRVNVLNK